MVLYIVTFFEMACFLVSLYCLVRVKPPLYLRFFPAFLFITIAVETTGHILNYIGQPNSDMYNFFGIFEFVFYSFVIYHVLKAKWLKLVVLYSILAYTVIALFYNCIVFDNRFHIITYIPGSIIIACFCCLYFYELVKTPVYKNPVYEPSFWICLGLLFYYSVTMPIMVVFGQSSQRLAVLLYYYILYATNILLYSSFAISFIFFVRFRK
jgi:hypothetical protein